MSPGYPTKWCDQLLQGQTINMYHFVTELKQIHDVGVHHIWLSGTPPEKTPLDMLEIANLGFII